jgi:sulfur-oxidizing protein SoxX
MLFRVNSQRNLPPGVARRLILLWLAILSAAPISAMAATPTISTGRALFLDERKGNCAACHKVPNDAAIKSASSIGASLEAIKARYPDRTKLRDVIWDLSKTIPNTIMPPYGKYRILSIEEIDALVIYLESI